MIKPYIGGGFGNKQDALYEPLCAWLSTQAGGRLVKLECQREETFMNTRVRHAIRFHIISWLREDGKLIARKAECYSNQGAYASHGHAVCANALASIPQIYLCENFEGDGWTVFTNIQAAGAMRGYGIPQATFAVESHTEDICARLGLDSAEYRRKNVMPKGYVDHFSKNELYYDTFTQTLDAGIKHTGYYRKRAEYANQSGNVRRGIGLALFWYKTGVWPTALETSACRMTMNQDGSIQLQVCETEIGQGADTAFSQMAAETLGIPFGKVHIVSSQDTDVTSFGLGAYASRQTYAAGMSIRNCAEAFKAHILETACRYTRMQPCIMDIADGNIIRRTDGRILMTLGELATEALYGHEHNNHLTMEKSTQIKTNAYSFGGCFAEVEVDIAMCQVKLINILNIHDAGRLINPALAEAQVHGGMSMGIGYALSEKMLYDSQTGRLLNGNLLDYKLPTMMDHPNLTAQFIETYEPTSAYGTKALGEPPVRP